MEVGEDFFAEVEIPEFNVFYLCIKRPWDWVLGIEGQEILS